MLSGRATRRSSWNKGKRRWQIPQQRMAIRTLLLHLPQGKLRNLFPSYQSLRKRLEIFVLICLIQGSGRSKQYSSCGWWPSEAELSAQRWDERITADIIGLQSCIAFHQETFGACRSLQAPSNTWNSKFIRWALEDTGYQKLYCEFNCIPTITDDFWLSFDH